MICATLFWLHCAVPAWCSETWDAAELLLTHSPSAQSVQPFPLPKCMCDFSGSVTRRRRLMPARAFATFSRIVPPALRSLVSMSAWV